MEITLSTLIEQFASTKKIEGRTDKTVNWYKDMLSRFVKFKGDVQLRSLTLDDARAFTSSNVNPEALLPASMGISPPQVTNESNQTLSLVFGLTDTHYHGC
jgi:hypothetical protein